MLLTPSSLETYTANSPDKVQMQGAILPHLTIEATPRIEIRENYLLNAEPY